MYKQLALENQVWLSLGGFPEQHPTRPDKFYTTHFIINSDGMIFSKYQKMHLFVSDLSSKGGTDIHENIN